MVYGENTKSYNHVLLVVGGDPDVPTSRASDPALQSAGQDIRLSTISDRPLGTAPQQRFLSQSGPPLMED
jgi:hypothetical protein